VEVNGENYNYGEQPGGSGPVQKGQTAGIGFWNNRNGQALIKALNGGTGTQLAEWLAATLPDVYGTQAGDHSLVHQDGTFFSNDEVAAFFQRLFNQAGPKLDAQVLAVALAVYVTNEDLAGTTASAYGFQVSASGVGSATFDVGTSGAAFGVANGTTLTVMGLLFATDARTRTSTS